MKKNYLVTLGRAGLIVSLVIPLLFGFVSRARPAQSVSFALIVNIITDTTPPTAVTDLVAFAGPSMGEITLTWTAPGDDGISGDIVGGMYWIKYSTTGIIKDDVTWSSAPYEVKWTTNTQPGISEIKTISGLHSNITYYFAMKTRDEVANNWSGLSNPASDTTVRESLVAAVIKTPKDGKKVRGDSLTVMAEIVKGSISDVKHVLFEYKSSSSRDWLPIPAPNNPDNSSPYFVHWDVSKLTEGSYNLRARATDISGVSDPNPPYLTVIVIKSSHDTTAMVIESEPDIEEWANKEGERYKREKLLNSEDNRVVIGRDKRNCFTEIEIPRGSLDTETAMLKVIVNPVSLPLVQRWIRPIGEYLLVELENGQVLLANNKKGTLVVPYKDEDNDGRIDGINIPEKRLIALCHRKGWRTWRKDFEEKLDEVDNIFRITAGHLSIFGLFTPIVGDLSNVIVYPNPFKPHLGHNEIYFKGLTEKTTIKIYNIAGELVRQIDNIDGEAVWDARNDSGNKVASGIYIYIMTNDKGNKKTGKLAIIK